MSEFDGRPSHPYTVTGDRADGGPAFPTSNGGSPDDGMTLRDYFAARALPLIFHDYWEAGVRDKQPIQYGEGPDDESTDLALIAEHAYQMADAMLTARKS